MILQRKVPSFTANKTAIRDPLLKGADKETIDKRYSAPMNEILIGAYTSVPHKPTKQQINAAFDILVERLMPGIRAAGLIVKPLQGSEEYTIGLKITVYSNYVDEGVLPDVVSPVDDGTKANIGPLSELMGF